MTKTEAYKLLLALPRYDCYVNHRVVEHEGIKHLDEIDNFDYDELLEYFQSLDLPYELVLKFITDELDGYANLNNENQGDDYDYLELWRREDGKLDLGVWTEVCGNMYFLSEYGKTWKEYVLSEEEIKAREESAAKYKAEIGKTFEEVLKLTQVVFPSLMSANEVEIQKMEGLCLSEYKRILDKKE